MAFENPFEAEGVWLKGNLHTHTTVSDGLLPPQERVAAYQARGYDFLALTDHERLADLQSVKAKGIILIRGAEFGCTNPTGGPSFHVVGLDLPKGFQLPSPRPAQAAVDAIRDAGGQAILAHPYWCGHTIRDLEAVAGCLGVEVFNTTCQRSIGKGTSAVHWDDLLTQGKPLMGFAVDDCHDSTRDAFQGWVMAKCARRSRKAVMDALARGLFYATCGPTIESLRLNGRRITVRTSPVAYISFICDGSRGGHVFHLDGAPVTEAEFALHGSEVFVRVECADATGRMAWSNPFFREQW